MVYYNIGQSLSQKLKVLELGWEVYHTELQGCQSWSQKARRNNIITKTTLDQKTNDDKLTAVECSRGERRRSLKCYRQAYSGHRSKGTRIIRFQLHSIEPDVCGALLVFEESK